MNIPKQIQDAATARGLSLWGTGGGYDYVVRFFPDDTGVLFDEEGLAVRPLLVLSDVDPIDQSPPSLHSPAMVSLTEDSYGWQHKYSLRFATAADAMDFMEAVESIAPEL